MYKQDGIEMNVFEIYYNGKWREQLRIYDDHEFHCEVQAWFEDYGDDYAADDEEFKWRIDKEKEYFHDCHEMARISN